MPRPKNKQQLITAANANFQTLWEQIDALSEKEFNTEFDFTTFANLKEAHWQRDKNVRDILIHLYEWHQLLLNWINANQKVHNNDPPIKFLPSPYTFKTIAPMNKGFWEKHQQTTYEQAVALLESSHAKVMTLIDTFTNNELFIKQHFSWTGTTSLGSYCVSATSSHYDWAIKKIKKHKQCLK